MNDFDTQSFKAAAPKFEEVERQHPYSIWAIKAQLMGAYSYYAEDKYEEALDILVKFLQLYPNHSSAPYAFYLKGLCYYERISKIYRDQKMTEYAREAFQELVMRFPLTAYAKDAKIKLNLINNHLAGKEMEIGRFYLKHKKYVAAMIHFKKVVKEYETTHHIEEALYRLTETYYSFGIYQEAKRYAAILRYNYPQSIWYKRSYAFLSKID